MIDELVELLNELFDVMARNCRKFYDSLVKVGFNPDEAVGIVASQGAGIKPN